MFITSAITSRGPRLSYLPGWTYKQSIIDRRGHHKQKKEVYLHLLETLHNQNGWLLVIRRCLIVVA